MKYLTNIKTVEDLQNAYKTAFETNKDDVKALQEINLELEMWFSFPVSETKEVRKYTENVMNEYGYKPTPYNLNSEQVLALMTDYCETMFKQFEFKVYLDNVDNEMVCVVELLKSAYRLHPIRKELPKAYLTDRTDGYNYKNGLKTTKEQKVEFLNNRFTDPIKQVKRLISVKFSKYLQNNHSTIRTVFTVDETSYKQDKKLALNEPTLDAIYYRDND